MSAISVVIPTAGRSVLLRRALESVAAQTLPPFEILVVVARPDGPTETVLAELEPRMPALRILRPEGPLRGGAARQFAVTHARGEWIAFLDDDDEWLPSKLATQWAAVRNVPGDHVVSFHRFLARRASGDERGPRALPEPGENIADYVLVRRSFFRGAAGAQTSTILARRSLLLQVPFRNGGPEDMDWIIRAAHFPGTRWVPVPEVLTIWHSDTQRSRVSLGRSWQSIVQWLDDLGPLVSPRAYASYLLVEGSARASAARDLSAFSTLLRRAFAKGRPSALDLLVFFSFWLIPQQWRVGLRRSLHR